MDPTGSAAEISFISGVSISGVIGSGQVAATSYATWNGDDPATYNGTYSYVAKWGSTPLGLRAKTLPIGSTRARIGQLRSSLR